MNNTQGDTLTIPNAAAISNALLLGQVEEVIIQGPASLPETIKVQVALDLGTTYGVYQEVPGTDVTIAAGKAVRIKGGAGKLTLVSTGGNVAGDRTFLVRLIRP